MAIAVLSVGVGAAAQLSLTMRKQEEANAHVARALNLLESAHRLHQLGLSPATITAILPQDPTATVTSSASALTIPAQVAAVEAIDWTVRCTPVPGQVVGGSVATRDFKATSIRESIRF
jgi:hypothetical protein